MKEFLKVDGKGVGVYDDVTLTYTKNVQLRVHKMWKHQGYGIQQDVIKTLVEKKCKNVVIMETDTGDVFTSKLIDWVGSGISEEHGYGLQIFLPVKDMTKK